MPISPNYPILAFYANNKVDAHNAAPECDSVYSDLEKWKNEKVCLTEDRAKAVSIIRDAMERDLTSLELSGLNLTQAPPIPEPLRGRLVAIDLSNNQLEALPLDFPEQLGGNGVYLNVRGNPLLFLTHALMQELTNLNICWDSDEHTVSNGPEFEEIAHEPQCASLDGDDDDPLDAMKDADEIIEAYKATRHDNHPVWQPQPRRPWAEPLLQLLTMGMPVFHNWAQGEPLLGPLPEPRRNDLAIDAPDRRVYEFMNNAAGREMLIDELRRALDEWQQSPEYIAERDRDALAQGWALTAELEDTFANPLHEELAAETLDYLSRNFVYCADNLNNLHSAKRDREAGSRSVRETQNVQEDARNPMRETGSHRASEAVPAFATSAGLSALEAQKAPLLGVGLAGLSITNPNLRAGALAATGMTLVGGAATAAYGLYSRLTRDNVSSVAEIEAYSDDESHDDEIVANLQIPQELEALISGVTNAPAPLARRVRSASANINQPNSIDEYKPNFSKYDDHVARNLQFIWKRSGDYHSVRGNNTRRLMIFISLLDRLINPRVIPPHATSDHLMVAAIGEFDAVRSHLQGIDDSMVSEHLASLDNYPGLTGPLSKATLYREAFSIREIDDDVYASRCELAGNFIYRKRNQNAPIGDIDNMSAELIYSRGIRDAERSFREKMSRAIPTASPEMLPNVFAKIYKDEIYSHGRELVDYFTKKRGFTSNADYKDGLPSDPESEARIELTNVKKYHALTLFTTAMADHGIYKKLKEYGVSYGQYHGYQAVLEAKKLSAKLVIEKFGIDTGGENFDADYYIDAYNQIVSNESVSDEVKQYLLKSASMAFYLVRTDDLPAHLTWHPDMLTDFYSSMEHDLPSLNVINSRPDDHIDIGSFKRSSDCSSKEEYFNQFFEYKKSSLAYDAKSVALNMLHAAGLSEYDISAAKPKAILGVDLRLYWSYSRGLGELLQNGGDWSRKYIDLDNPRTAGNYITEPHAYGGPDNAIGKMAFVEMADGRMIAIALINGKSKAKEFSADQVRSSRVLRRIKASMQSGLPQERDDMVRARRGSSKTSPYIDIEGKVLIDEVLKPLFGDDYKYIGFTENRRGYVKQAFPQLTAAQNLNLDLKENGEGLYPLATAVANNGLEEFVASLKGGLEDRQWWQYVIMFVPFAEEIYKSAVDKDHKVDARSIAADVVGTIFSLIPFVGKMGKLSAATTKIFESSLKRAMAASMKKGLTGKKLTMEVLVELAKEAPALRAAGLKALASAAYAAADVGSPVPPDLLVSSVTRLTNNIRKYLNQSTRLNGQFPVSMGGRLSTYDANVDLMNAAGDEVGALGRTATITPSADKPITLRSGVMTPGQAIEEGSALVEPLSRKQPSVIRAGEDAPYSFIDVCATPRRVARSPGEILNCFPLASRSDRRDLSVDNSNPPVVAPVSRKSLPDAAHLGAMSRNIEFGPLSRLKLGLAKYRNRIQTFDVKTNKFVDSDEYETLAIAGRTQLQNSRFLDEETVRAKLRDIGILYEDLNELSVTYSGADAVRLRDNLSIGEDMINAAIATNIGDTSIGDEVFVTLKKGRGGEVERIIGVAHIKNDEAFLKGPASEISELDVDFVVAHPYTIVNKYPDFREYVIDKLRIPSSELDNYRLKHSGLQTVYAGLKRIYDERGYSHVKKITTKAVNPITANEFRKLGGAVVPSQ
ncbi:hypothetical protein [Burkholderia ambifaria]|uniref:hypothetical protein n=1 Tax=Burkholderia ambifaria TaxID=152480 RepID=UPI00158BA67A|nr:hypothetical protein [Burkholderia ambifaria]